MARHSRKSPLVRRIERRLPVEVDVVMAGRLVSAPFSYDISKTVYLSLFAISTFETAGDDEKPMLFSSILYLIQVITEEYQQMARLFPPSAMTEIVRTIHRLCLYAPCQQSATRIWLKQHHLEMAFLVAQLVIRWRRDLLGHSSLEIQQHTENLRKGQGKSRINSHLEALWTLLSRPGSEALETLLLTILYGRAGGVAKQLLAALRARQQEEVDAVVIELETLSLRLSRLEPLIHHLIGMFINSVEAEKEEQGNGQDPESIFADLPSAKASALVAMNAAAGHGSGLVLFDTGQTVQLYTLRKKAAKIVGKFGAPVSRKDTIPAQSIPVVYGGQCATNDFTRRPIDLVKTCLRLEMSDRIEIVVRPFEMARFEFPLPPQDIPPETATDLALPPLVVAIDSSGSTDTKISGSTQT